MATASEDRLCWHCKHMVFDPGEPGYSEVTPGSDAQMHCDRDVWDMYDADPFPCSLEKLLQKARSCTQFEELELEDES